MILEALFLVGAAIYLQTAYVSSEGSGKTAYGCKALSKLWPQNHNLSS